MATRDAITMREIHPRFFEGLAPSEIRAVTSAAKLRRYLRGSVIVNQETPADHFFLLTTGRARYFYWTRDGRKVILFWLPAGEIFGAAALLSRPSDYLVCTEAVKDSSVLVWDRSTIRTLVARYSQLTDNVLSTMQDYLIGYRAIHVSLACHAAPQRLAQVLVNLAEGIGRRVVGGIELDIRNEELANEANITTFTASRLLREWQHKGALRKRRGKLLLQSAEKLPLRSI